MKRICFLAPPESVHTSRWTQAFVNLNYDVHLITFGRVEIPGVKVHSISPFMDIKSKWKYITCLTAAKKLVYSINPDILHAHWASTYAITGSFSKFHPFFVSSWGRDIFCVPGRNPVTKEMLKWAFSNADVITSTSQWSTKETRKYVPKEKNIYTIPFGVDLDNFIPHTQKDDINSITIGTARVLDKKYGIEYLLKAFKKVLSIFPTVTLKIAGSGPSELKLKRMSDSMSISKKVEFLGWVTHSQIPKFLSKLDIFVMPSIGTSETFGVSACEASAMELPVIASKVGGLPEVVKHNETGLLVAPKDTKAIANAIITLIKSPKMRRRMGKKGRALVKRYYNWQENVKEMENLYKLWM